MHRVRAGSIGLLAVFVALAAPLSASADDNDEMFFYRTDGLYRYYNVRPDGNVGTPIEQGSGYTRDWTSITAVDLDGDGQDEMFFYRADGLFRFYNVRADGSLGSPIAQGDGYTRNWTSISAVDLDGDGQDEMFFYREDGLYRYYNVRPNGNVGTPILQGDGYTRDWTSISAVDLEGDGQDEMFFYRADGLYRYYNVRPNGNVGTPILQGSNYTSGWDAITAVNLDANVAPIVPTTFGDGYHVVGTDIPPGTYRTTGSFAECYWSRWSGLTGSDDEYITDAYTTFPEIITVEPSDAALYTEGCGTWTSKMNILGRTPTDPLHEGTLRVGTEVAPGLWANDSFNSEGCFWARVSAFTWEEADYLAGGSTTEPTVIEIFGSDAGFWSEGCGLWNYLGP